MEGQMLSPAPLTHLPSGLCSLETTLNWESPKRSAVIRRTHPIMPAGAHTR